MPNKTKRNPGGREASGPLSVPLPEARPVAKPRLVTLTVEVQIQAIAIPEMDGGFSVAVPALQGCFTDGLTIEEAMANAKEATEGWLASMHDQRVEATVRAMSEPLPSEADA